MNLDASGEFRLALIRLKNRLSESAGNTTAALRRQVTLEQVEAALRRVEERTYGTCRDCYLIIPRAELLMRPYSVTCPDCRRRRGAA